MVGCASSVTPDEPSQYPRQPRKEAARRGLSPIPGRHGLRLRAPQPSLCAPGFALERPVPAAQLLRHIPRVHPRVALAHEFFVDHHACCRYDRYRSSVPIAVEQPKPDLATPHKLRQRLLRFRPPRLVVLGSIDIGQAHIHPADADDIRQHTVAVGDSNHAPRYDLPRKPRAVVSSLPSRIARGRFAPRLAPPPFSPGAAEQRESNADPEDPRQQIVAEVHPGVVPPQ